jgi:hypothetical protein
MQFHGTRVIAISCTPSRNYLRRIKCAKYSYRNGSYRISSKSDNNCKCGTELHLLPYVDVNYALHYADFHETYNHFLKFYTKLI